MRDSLEYTNHSQFSNKYGKSKVDKLVISGSNRGRSRCGNRIVDALSRMTKEGRLTYSFQANSYDIEVFIFKTGDRFGIDIYSAEFDFNFSNRIRGMDYDEAISDEEGARAILGNDLDGVIMSRLKVRDSSLLFRIVNDGNFLQLPYNHGKSWTTGYEFPASLYRVGMEQYFMDPNNPTQEEFLFAITTENVNAISPKEIEAVEKAKLYVENAGG